jgi:hypothetical protein
MGTSSSIMGRSSGNISRRRSLEGSSDLIHHHPYLFCLFAALPHGEIMMHRKFGSSLSGAFTGHTRALAGMGILYCGASLKTPKYVEKMLHDDHGVSLGIAVREATTVPAHCCFPLLTASESHDVLVSASNDGTIRVWEVNRGSCIMAFAPSSTIDFATPPQVHPHPDHHNRDHHRHGHPIVGFAFYAANVHPSELSVDDNPAAKFRGAFVVLTADGHVRAFEMCKEVSRVSVTPVGEPLLFSGGSWLAHMEGHDFERVPFRLNSSTLKDNGRVYAIFAAGDGVAEYSMAFSSGKSVMDCSDDIPLLQHIHYVPVPTCRNSVSSVAYVPPRRDRAVVGGFDAIVCLDLKTGLPIWIKRNHPDLVSAVAVTADGRSVGSACVDGSLHFWKVDGAKQESYPSVHNSAIYNIEFVRDDQAALLTGGKSLTFCALPSQPRHALPQYLNAASIPGDVIQNFVAPFLTMADLPSRP